MPLFEYTCGNCSYNFDKMVQRWDDRVICPLCSGSVKKLMSTFSVGESRAGTTHLPTDFKPKMCTNC
ncbi:MAG: FmdB family zinc ribbon protein [Deltaproteobacteria bacterium]|jgi:putative FmdB family regulatory protein|nr:FmdB family zinc ribbon protein [Deltaproteobacteria bacterium]